MANDARKDLVVTSKLIYFFKLIFKTNLKILDVFK